MADKIIDSLNRKLSDLRISVTDRCNFRCRYCMPREIFGKDYQYLPHGEILSFEEITRLARIFVSLGVRKIRLTGGEPLMRRDLESLIELLVEIDGLDDLALITNGSFPIERISSLKKAGVDRITVSLDSLDDAVLRQLSDTEISADQVVRWIDQCVEEGFDPVKINMVVKRGVNDQDILPMAKRFNQQKTVLRFIEYMDVGSTNDWNPKQVVAGKEIVGKIGKETAIIPLDPNYPGEVARRWKYVETGNEFGVITSVSQPFCGDCTRVRMSARGTLYTCLFAQKGKDLRKLVRSGVPDAEIRKQIIESWMVRDDRYSELRSNKTAHDSKIEMSYIGG